MPDVPPGHDPRNCVTEDAFRLAPELLGTPLARPWRRGAAMAVDVVLVGLLSNAPSVLFGFAAALVLFRASSGRAHAGYVRAGLRLMFRFWGAVVLFVFTLMAWDSVADWFADRGDEEAAVSAPEEDPDVLTGLAGIRAAAEIARFTQAEDLAAARRSAEEIVRQLRRSGMEDEDIEEVLTGLAEEDPTRPWLAAAADSAMRGPAAGAPAPEPGETAADSLAAAYAAALEAGDTAAGSEARRALAHALARDTIAELHQELDAAERTERELARQLEAAREEERGRGVLSVVRSFAEDLGLGVTWAALYFTAFVALWQGQTPGKRLLGIRVIRLDGKPIGWWAAFERFGGYAAGLATGLLGFFQIYWDRNRQAVHDKIAETVVIAR